jgi:hypothetical protein
MKKWFLIPASALLMAFTSSTQSNGGCEGYYMIEKGVTLEYKDYNAKDKLQGSQLTTITELSDVAGVLSATVHSISKDDKDKVTTEGDFNFTCKDGEITIDMKSMMDQQMMEGFEDMEVSIDQSNLVYPATFTEGQSLPDGTLTMKISSSGMVIMTMVIEVVDRKVEKFESVTTPAGTFDCVKLSQTTKMDMGMMKTTTKSIDWFSKSIGSVRNETYDKDGALQSYRILTQVIR